MMPGEIRFTKPILIAVILPAAVMSLIDSYQGWRFLFFTLAALWGISFWWARSLARHISVKREIRFGWAQVGDRVEERFTLTNYGYLPALYIRVIDHSNLADLQVNRIASVGSRETISWKSVHRCHRRGLFAIGPTSYSTGDPFGFYSVTLHDRSWKSILVTPPVLPLPNVDITPGGKAGAGRSRSHTIEPVVSAESVRQYQPGESLNSIHWRTSARKQELYVRKFSSTPASDWWIYLDLDADAHYETDAGSSLEQAIVLTASLANHGLKLNYQVGLAAYSDRLIWLPPALGEYQRLKILQELALVNAGNHSLGSLLTRARTRSSQATSHIIVTTWLEASWIEAVHQYIKIGAYPTIFILEPTSFGLQPLPQGQLAILTKMGLRVHLIDRQILEIPETELGSQGEWEWLTSATGKAIPIRKPKNLEWRGLDETLPG